MTERLLILLPTPIILPPINGLSLFTRPLGVAFVALSVGAGALGPPVGEFGCPPLLVAPCGVVVFGGFDWPNPDKPKLFPCCGLFPAGTPGCVPAMPGICKFCGGFRLPMSWPAGPI